MALYVADVDMCDGWALWLQNLLIWALSAKNVPDYSSHEDAEACVEYAEGGSNENGATLDDVIGEQNRWPCDCGHGDDPPPALEQTGNHSRNKNRWDHI